MSSQRSSIQQLSVSSPSLIPRVLLFRKVLSGVLCPLRSRVQCEQPSIMSHESQEQVCIHCRGSISRVPHLSHTSNSISPSCTKPTSTTPSSSMCFFNSPSSSVTSLVDPDTNMSKCRFCDSHLNSALPVRGSFKSSFTDSG